MNTLTNLNKMVSYAHSPHIGDICYVSGNITNEHLDQYGHNHVL